MIDMALQIVSAGAAGVILYRAEPALNRMSGHTHIMVRISMFLLVVASAAQLGSVVLFGHIPSASEALLFAGVASLLSCERAYGALSASR